MKLFYLYTPYTYLVARYYMWPLLFHRYHIHFYSLVIFHLHSSPYKWNLNWTWGTSQCFRANWLLNDTHKVQMSGSCCVSQQKVFSYLQQVSQLWLLLPTPSSLGTLHAGHGHAWEPWASPNPQRRLNLPWYGRGTVKAFQQGEKTRFTPRFVLNPAAWFGLLQFKAPPSITYAAMKNGCWKQRSNICCYYLIITYLISF